ncbi:MULTISPECIES: response regulator [Spirosoma]|uniref:Response regulator n=1 Tax=Spirosoma liriopis TaxID=2937440 RepID=A0ABT0HEG1_9BACT|nr:MULTISPECIES: response regulator [Spirosoma]MCK8490548.1 response regulator [Spirosoma liriopis]UHG89917.1 response regulator [Spirosoma oryzicola]
MNQYATQAVFIADDDEDDRYLLQIAFREYCPACQLRFATDGLNLLDALTQTDIHPCLIILDMNMPRLNGLESLSVLRSNPLYQKTPIIILTTSSAAGDRQRAHELGANDFITKPLSLNLFGPIIHKLRETWHLDGCI